MGLRAGIPAFLGLGLTLGLGACSRCSSPAREDAGGGRDAAPAPDAAREARVEEPADRAELPVFRFGPNVLLAHVQRGDGLWVDAGSAGFVKYLRFGLPELRWDLQQEREGVRVAVPERVASIEVPLTATQAASDSIYLGVHATAATKLSLKIDGRKAGGVELAPGWQIARLEVPEKRLRAGESFLALETSGRERPALAWLQVGGSAPAVGAATTGAAAAPSAMAAPVRYEPDEDVLVLARDAGLVYHVLVPETGRLVTAVEGAECRVSVRAQAGEGAPEGERQAEPQASINETLAGASPASRAVVDLALLAGRVARVEISATGCAEARLLQPRITMAGAAHALPTAPPPKYVVLWLMSGLRADRVRPFAPWARPEAPGFERLAQTGMAFSPTWTQSPASRAARAALWTGRYPMRLGADAGGGAEPERAREPDGKAGRKRDQTPDQAPDEKPGQARRRARAPSLGVEMREAGFQTVAVTAAMDRAPGFVDGFEVWERVTGANPELPAAGAEVLATAMQRLEERHGKGPVFLVIETADSRLPWTAHEPWIGRYDPGVYQGPFDRMAGIAELGASPLSGRAGFLLDRMECDRTPEGRDLERLRAIYDTTVSYQDALLVQLVDRLAQWGILDQTLLVITSDHGQEMWEDGRCGHGTSFRESVLGVPLLLHYPPLLAGGRMAARGAEAVDVLPTLLRVLGLTTPEPVQGQSLLELAEQPGYPEPMFAAFEDVAHAVRLGSWKLLAGRAGVAAVYDLAADPNEARNLAATHGIERRFLTDVLSLHVFHRAQWNQRAWGVAANLTTAGWQALEGR
jgi:arylsulfatase A-like enzyme